MKIHKNLLIVFISTFLLLSVGFVSAVKIETTQTNVNGYQIFYPDIEIVPQNSVFKLHIHANNISTGYPLDNTQADCFVHLYNPDGNHTFEGKLGLDGNGQDWDVFIDKGNFSVLGTHSFYIWCNDTYFGGEAKGVFDVTITGEERQYHNPFFYSLIGLIILFMILGLSFPKEKWKIKSLFFIFALFFGLILINSVRLSLSSSGSMNIMIVTTLITMLVLVIFMFLYIFIYALIEVFSYFKKKKEAKWNSDPW